jgi:hypothetical protein
VGAGLAQLHFLVPVGAELAQLQFGPLFLLASKCRPMLVGGTTCLCRQHVWVSYKPVQLEGSSKADPCRGCVGGDSVGERLLTVLAALLNNLFRLSQPAQGQFYVLNVIIAVVLLVQQLPVALAHLLHCVGVCC